VPIYQLGAGSKLTVKARSRVHDTTTVWDSIEGTVETDPATIETTGAKVAVAVDMTRYDAGDFLKNRKLRKDFELDAHPRATFDLVALEGVTRGAGDRLTAKARGTLRWRGREVALVVEGSGVLDANGLDVSARFDLDIRQLGLSAPRFLMFKMEDEVTIDVVLKGGVR
jgi:polyisoprenoid-binding protein YceI